MVNTIHQQEYQHSLNRSWIYNLIARKYSYITMGDNCLNWYRLFFFFWSATKILLLIEVDKGKKINTDSSMLLCVN